MISIVAIFLALAIGISLGSGFVGGPVVEDLRQRIDSVRGRNEDLRGRVDELDRRVDEGDKFAGAVKPWLIDDALAGTAVIVVQFERTEEALRDAAVAAVEQAGGEVTTTITILDKLALQSQPEREELARMMSASSKDPEVLRSELASSLGGGVAAAAAGGDGVATDGVGDLLESLQRTGYARVEQHGGTLVSAGAAVLMLAGGSDRPPFDPRGFTATLVGRVGNARRGVVVAENVTSQWAVTTFIREHERASRAASTIDHADNAQGQIALVLSLKQAVDGAVGHYGFKDGATSPIPQPSSAVESPP